jgi:hypothetical protein
MQCVKTQFYDQASQICRWQLQSLCQLGQITKGMRQQRLELSSRESIVYPETVNSHEGNVAVAN